MPICQAVQHAHQKGIVHRDLKPANILVTIIDGKPIPKVIDFGVAKAIAGKLTDESMSTQFGAVIGTLEYMAPEQAGFSGVDIDTRADIYSLGVILYELLTGLRPIDAKRLRKAALTEMIRIIQEEEPTKPSTRLSTDESLPSLAALRQTDPRKLMALLRGELDWVVMKCLEKHRERRYETANALARDIQRYLADEAVEARPPSARYRLGKFLHRNRRPVLAASLVLLALVVGIVGTSFGLIRAEVRRSEAEQARDRTRQALDAMTSWVTEDSLGSQKEIGDAQKKFLTEALTYYREFAGEKADDQASRPRTAAAAYRVGRIEFRLGRNAEAEAAWRQALDGYAKLVAEFPAVPKYRKNLAMIGSNLGNLLDGLGKLPDAEAHYRESQAILEKLVAEFPTDPDYRQHLARTVGNLGILMRHMRRLPEAEAQYRKSVAILEKLVAEFPADPEHRDYLAGYRNNLGNLLTELGKRSEALEQLREALAIQEKVVAEFPTNERYRLGLAHIDHNLGKLLMVLGQRPEAEAHYRKSLAIYEKLAAEFPAVPEHRNELAGGHNNLAVLLAGLGKQPEAEEQYRKSLAILEKLAAEFPAMPEYREGLAIRYNNLGRMLAGLGKRSEAEEPYRKALAIYEKLVADFPAVPQYRIDRRNSYQMRAVAYDRLRKFNEANKDWERAIELSSAVTQPRIRAARASSRIEAGQVAEAVAEVAELTKSSRWDFNQWYNFACVYALASDKIADKKQEYADRAMGLLQQAVKAGYNDAVHMAQDKDFDPIRGRDDFNTLIEKLEQSRPLGARALSRLQAGQVAEAVAEVAELAKSPKWDSDQWYNFACIYSIASAKSADKRREYADQAMDLLKKAVNAGYNNAAHMAQDTDLDPIRGRDDFKTLIEELAKKSPARPEPKP